MVYAHHRKLDAQEAVVAFNASKEDAKIEIQLPDGNWHQDEGEDWEIEPGGLFKATISGRDSLILVNQ